MEKQSDGMKKNTVNKKIRNARIVEFNGIRFKSSFEKEIYSTLVDTGFDVKYESETFTLIPSFEPKTPFYDKESISQRAKRISQGDNDVHRLLAPNMKKVISVKYTPDFVVKYKGVTFYIEAKGWENDVFYLKKKLFRLYLDNIAETTGKRSVYFEVYTKHQLHQIMYIIKDYEVSRRNEEENP